jgi:hypothetical protein
MLRSGGTWTGPVPRYGTRARVPGSCALVFGPRPLDRGALRLGRARFAIWADWHAVVLTAGLVGPHPAVALPGIVPLPLFPPALRGSSLPPCSTHTFAWASSGYVAASSMVRSSAVCDRCGSVLSSTVLSNPSALRIRWSQGARCASAPAGRGGRRCGARAYAGACKGEIEGQERK